MIVLYSFVESRSTRLIQIDVLQCITMLYTVHVCCVCFDCILGRSESWLSLLLPHCLAKIDRVSFGIMTAEDRAVEGETV